MSEEEPTGRQRLWAALRRPGSRGQITAAVLLAVVGFASVVQVRATEADDVYAGMRQEDMLQLLNSLAAASERTENQIAELEDTRSSLRNNTEARQAALEEARRKADVLGILAGTLPAVGPGVVVTVKDPQGAVGVDQLLNGVEELRDAGAEAIEVNDTVRVVAQTAFKDGDTGIVVGEQPLAPPYTIEAIGDPHTLTTGLNFHGGFVDLIEGEAVGGDVVIKQASTVEIASTREPESARYSEPVEDE
ncbi:MAG TPA: DUF881 domain-containing protein [Nocardioidaceae bacterium]|nr:DUF881 domain-containing protein [Nocardioidaceae bacterium]